jgi:DNA replication initiation complex subunit (GINS family)
MLTLGDLQSIYRRESSSSILQKLPEDFITQVQELLNSPDLGEYSSEIKDFYEKILVARRNKILNYCTGPNPEKPIENATDEEEEFRKAVLEEINKYMKHKGKTEGYVRKEVKAVKKKIEEVLDDGFMEVSFLQDMQEFIGVDTKPYGPYTKGDTVRLPVENARILLKQDVVEET